MRAVITGATGLLGRHIATALHAQGYDITAIVRETSDRTFLNQLGVQFHAADLSRKGALVPEVFRNADVVFHCAAAVTDWAPWPYFVANTIDATCRVCDAMTVAGCRRLVHISTVGVYGRPHTTSQLREDQPYSSIGRWDYYTNSKIAAEQIVRARHDLDVTILRPAMIYGPGTHGLVARVADYLRTGKAAIAGDPGVTLPLVHVEDVTRAALLAATTPAAIGEAFNIVNPEPVTQADFFNTIASLLGLSSATKRIPYRLAYTAGLLAEIVAHATRSAVPPLFSRYRVSLFGHQRRYAIEKAVVTLGWQPRIAFHDGIRQTVATL
ncbi:MAG: NAD-dependent epimerase/dehydratase family protein [Verrucomicrobia bacterium]|nr:NAD-dependent epimerase/dehydratase family protein [Verrucomicrobiota bacterium]